MLVLVVSLCPSSVHVVATFGLYCSACFGSLCPSSVHVVANFGLYFSACFGSLCPSSVHVVATFSGTVKSRHGLRGYTDADM